MSRKYLLDCSANGAKWADDVHLGIGNSDKRFGAKRASFILGHI